MSKIKIFVLMSAIAALIGGIVVKQKHTTSFQQKFGVKIKVKSEKYLADAICHRNEPKTRVA